MNRHSTMQKNCFVPKSNLWVSSAMTKICILWGPKTEKKGVCPKLLKCLYLGEPKTSFPQMPSKVIWGSPMTKICIFGEPKIMHKICFAPDSHMSGASMTKLCNICKFCGQKTANGFFPPLNAPSLSFVTCSCLQGRQL